jgi:hypothetical protein
MQGSLSLLIKAATCSRREQAEATSTATSCTYVCAGPAWPALITSNPVWCRICYSLRALYSCTQVLNIAEYRAKPPICTVSSQF